MIEDRVCGQSWGLSGEWWDRGGGQFGMGLGMELGIGHRVQERGGILQSIPELGWGLHWKGAGGLYVWFFLWDLSTLCGRGGGSGYSMGVIYRHGGDTRGFATSLFLRLLGLGPPWGCFRGDLGCPQESGSPALSCHEVAVFRCTGDHGVQSPSVSHL